MALVIGFGRRLASLALVAAAAGLVVAGAMGRGERVGAWRPVSLGLPTAHGYVYSEADAVSNSGLIVGWAWGESVIQSRRSVEWRPTQQGWRAISLGRLRDDFLPSDVNDSGTVAGTIGPGLVGEHAVVWKGSQFTDLPVPAGSDAFASRALAINNLQQVAGWEEVETPELTRHAVIWDADGTLTDLGTLGFEASEAYALNQTGEAVGVAWNGDITETKVVRAFLWSGGRMRALPGLAGSHHTYAYAINDSGVIVGSSDTAAGVSKPVMWRNGRVYELPLPAGARNADAADINESGLIVGNYGTGNEGVISHVVVWRNGKPFELPANRSSYTGAFAINDSGLIVGRNGLHAAAWRER